jgi:hypothetical protein
MTVYRVLAQVPSIRPRFAPTSKQSGRKSRQGGRQERGDVEIDVRPNPMNPICCDCCPFPPAVNSIGMCWTPSSSSSSDSESITIVFCGCSCGGGWL